MELSKDNQSFGDEYSFTQIEIEMLLKRKQDFLDGKTTARDWKEIEDDLNQTYPSNS